MMMDDLTIDLDVFVAFMESSKEDETLVITIHLHDTLYKKIKLPKRRKYPKHLGINMPHGKVFSFGTRKRNTMLPLAPSCDKMPTKMQ